MTKIRNRYKSDDEIKEEIAIEASKKRRLEEAHGDKEIRNKQMQKFDYLIIDGKKYPTIMAAHYKLGIGLDPLRRAVKAKKRKVIATFKIEYDLRVIPKEIKE